MEFERKLKVRKLRENQQIHEQMPKREMNLMDLPIEILEHVASFLPRNQLQTFGLVSKKSHQVFQQIDHKILYLRNCVRVDEKKMLEAVKTRNYITLILNECHWLSSKAVLELVSKNSVRELVLIDCECTPEAIDRIAKLSLTSLTFTWTQNWIDFFVSKEFNWIPCLKELKKLQILNLQHDLNEIYVSHVSRYVLCHCPNLEYLKLHTHPSHLNFGDLSLVNETRAVFQARDIPTPVPKLKILVLNLNLVFEDVSNLMKLILNKKESPLKRIYLGEHTAKAISSGIFCSKNVAFEKSKTLILSSIVCDSNNYRMQTTSGLLSVPGFESAVDCMLKAPSCKTIYIENVILDNLQLITVKVIKSGSSSINEISLRGCKIEGKKSFIRSIAGIANFCTRIYVLDLSNTRWNGSEFDNFKLLVSLSNLTKLRTLHLTPTMLSGETGQHKNALQLCLRNLAEGCKFLKYLRIVNTTDCGPICENVLSCIKYFKNLIELHLARFSTSGKQCALSEIAKGCAQLNCLYIKNVINVQQANQELPWEQIFVHTKQLKHLSLLQKFTITQEFVDSLVECTQMQKLCVRALNREAIAANLYFAYNLRKLAKLKVFIAFGSPKVRENFRSAINRIEETKKPAFYGYSNYVNGTVLPLAHCHLLQHFSIDSEI